MHLLFNQKLYLKVDQDYSVLDYNDQTIYLMPDIGSDTGVAIHVAKHPRAQELIKAHGVEVLKFITERLFGFICQKISGKMVDEDGNVKDVSDSLIINLDYVMGLMVYKGPEKKEDDESEKEDISDEPEEVSGPVITDTKEAD